MFFAFLFFFQINSVKLLNLATLFSWPICLLKKLGHVRVCVNCLFAFWFFQSFGILEFANSNWNAFSILMHLFLSSAHYYNSQTNLMQRISLFKNAVISKIVKDFLSFQLPSENELCAKMCWLIFASFVYCFAQSFSAVMLWRLLSAF